MTERITMIPLAIFSALGAAIGYVWEGFRLGFIAGTDWANRHIDGPEGREPE